MTYWRDRELKHIEKMVKDDKKLTKRLARNQNRAVNDIQDQVDGFYGRYATKEGITMNEAKKRVAKADIKKYRSKAKRYVKEKNFTPIANEEMRLYNVTMKINRLELLKSNIHLELLAMTSEEQRILLESMTASARAEFKRQSGILGVTIQHNEKMLADIVNSSFQNATWSHRLWDNQDALRSELDRLLNRGIVQGLNPRELARDLRGEFDTSIYNSERLMRTEMGKLQIEVQKESYEKAEIEEYTIIVEPDGCDFCLDFDGEVFKVVDMQISVNAPVFHPNCRCSTSSYIERKG